MKTDAVNVLDFADHFWSVENVARRPYGSLDVVLSCRRPGEDPHYIGYRRDDDTWWRIAGIAWSTLAHAIHGVEHETRHGLVPPEILQFLEAQPWASSKEWRAHR